MSTVCYYRNNAFLGLTVDLLLGAGAKVTLPAAAAGEAVAAVPATTDALPKLPHLLPGRDGHNVADDLVARDAGILDGKFPLRNLFVTVDMGPLALHNDNQDDVSSKAEGSCLTFHKRRTQEPSPRYGSLRDPSMGR